MPGTPEVGRRWLELLQSKGAIKGGTVVSPDEKLIAIIFLDGGKFMNRETSFPGRGEIKRTDYKIEVEGEFLVRQSHPHQSSGRTYRALSDIIEVYVG